MFEYVELKEATLFWQELQHEVGSLLLFRQAVLAALPHLQNKIFVNANNNTSPVSSNITSSSEATAVKLTNAANTWTRRRHHVQQQFRSLLHSSSDASTSTATSTQNGVADSGFSTEANSNTSPRSSRFETATPNGPAPSSSSDLCKQAHDDPLKNAPMDKGLNEHLERVKNSRQGRLNKDEDRLLALLHGAHASADAAATAAADDDDAADDELWQLLEQIQNKGRQMKEEMLQRDGDEPGAVAGAGDGATGALLAGHGKDYFQKCLAHLQRDVRYLRKRQSAAEEDLARAEERCSMAAHQVHTARLRLQEALDEMVWVQDQMGQWDSTLDRSKHQLLAGQEDVVHLPQENLPASKKRVSFQEGIATLVPALSDAADVAAGVKGFDSSVKFARPSRDKVSAVLRISNPVQLQRHLLGALVDNEVTLH